MKVKELFEAIGGLNLNFARIETLEGNVPSLVGGDFSCRGNRLKSLKGGPLSVGGDFDCGDNLLKSLEFAPHFIDGDFDFSDNEITSLKGIHKIVNEINGLFVCDDNVILDGFIDILKIQGVSGVGCDHHIVNKILNKHCKESNIKDRVANAIIELIDAGLERYI